MLAFKACKALDRAIEAGFDPKKMAKSPAEKNEEEKKTEHLNRNLKGVDIDNEHDLKKVGLSRLMGEDFDILFDEDGNVYTLRGEYAGTYANELETYFQEYEKHQ